jgi:hypothetical protein
MPQQYISILLDKELWCVESDNRALLTVLRLLKRDKCFSWLLDFRRFSSTVPNSRIDERELMEGLNCESGLRCGLLRGENY